MSVEQAVDRVLRWVAATVTCTTVGIVISFFAFEALWAGAGAAYWSLTALRRAAR